MRDMLVDSSIRDYRIRVRVPDEAAPTAGTVWVREEDLEWEVEAGDVRLVTDVSDLGKARRDVVFRQLRRKLADDGVRLQTCGTCVHFRRASTGDDEEGWRGYCVWQDPEDEAWRPEAVAVLAPDCHHFAYREGPAEELDEALPADPTPEVPPADETASQPATGLLAVLKRLLGRSDAAEEQYVRTGAIERPGGQPCPCCATRMTNRASIANVSEAGEERILSVWRCPHCGGNYLDDWFEAYVGSRARDAERLYVVPPSTANVGARIVLKCPRPEIKGCTCVANQWFDEWGDGLYGVGRRAAHRESVVSL